MNIIVLTVTVGTHAREEKKARLTYRQTVHDEHREIVIGMK
jgi:hypothetical protein